MTADELQVILKDFLKNRFDPMNESEIPDSCGNYILCLRKKSSLPPVKIKPMLKLLDGHEVIYTGIASISLHNRDYKQHFKGNNAGRSTLRKSLGVLLGYEQIPRDKNPDSGKTKFNTQAEIELSEWMKANLILYFLPTTNFVAVEDALINHFNPPLNLKGNFNIVNSDFRNLLSSLRANKNNSFLKKKFQLIQVKLANNFLFQLEKI